MGNNSDVDQYELICVIVKYGLGSKVLRIARENGVSGGTVFLGKGTAHHRLLEILELADIRKEIVIMIAEKMTGNVALERIKDKLRLPKPNHGIAFTMPVAAFLGVGKYDYKSDSESAGVGVSMYKSIFVIVDRGKAEQVMETATKAGAKGGTIINARGSGIHETGRLFNVDIEPEKEVVMILSEDAFTESIVSSIREELEIDKPGNGIIFIQNVNKTYGVFE